MTPEGAGWSHVDERGEARMVDVSAKAATLRTARARGRVRMKASTKRDIIAGAAPKGSVLGVARIAGIQAAKQTSQWIPLCHPLPIEKASVEFAWEESPPEIGLLCIEAEVVVTAKTGVEMEALTAVCAAALAVYDMVKAVDPAIRIEDIHLLRKTGGKADFTE